MGAVWGARAVLIATARSWAPDLRELSMTTQAIAITRNAASPPTSQMRYLTRRSQVRLRATSISSGAFSSFFDMRFGFFATVVSRGRFSCRRQPG